MDFPIKNGVSFHIYVTHYQRVVVAMELRGFPLRRLTYTWWTFHVHLLNNQMVPSGKLTLCYGQSHFLWENSSINYHFQQLYSYVESPDGINCPFWVGLFVVLTTKLQPRQL